MPKKKAVKKKSVKKSVKKAVKHKQHNKKSIKPAKANIQKKPEEVIKVPMEPGTDKVKLKYRLFSMLSYLNFAWFPVFLIPLVLVRRNSFVRFHAKQGMLIYLSSMVIYAMATIFSTSVFGPDFIKAIFGIFMFILAVSGIVLFIFWIVAFIFCMLGRAWKIPYLGEFAVKLKI